MLSRLLPKPSHLRRFFSPPSKPYSHLPRSYFPNSALNPYFNAVPRFFSTNSSDNNNNGNGKDPFYPGLWKGFGESEEKFDALFAEDSENVAGVDDARVSDANEGLSGAPPRKEEDWWLQEKGLDNEDEDAIFKGIDKESEEKGGGFGQHLGVGAHDFKPWSLKKEEDEEHKDGFFSFQEDDVKQEGEFSVVESERSEDVEKLEKEEQELTAVLKGWIQTFFVCRTM